MCSLKTPKAGKKFKPHLVHTLASWSLFSNCHRLGQFESDSPQFCWNIVAISWLCIAFLWLNYPFSRKLLLEFTQVLSSGIWATLTLYCSQCSLQTTLLFFYLLSDSDSHLTPLPKSEFLHWIRMIYDLKEVDILELIFLIKL